MPQVVTKLSQVKELFESGDLRGALRVAARFPDLGDQENDIKLAHEAFVRPAFWKSIGRDPEKLIEAGRAALIARWGFRD